MSDPLTALKYAVHVMNFLGTLVVRAIREREDSIVDPPSNSASSDNAKLQRQISYADVLKSPLKRSTSQVQNQSFSSNPNAINSIPTHNSASNSVQEARNPDSNEGSEIKFFNTRSTGCEPRRNLSMMAPPPTIAATGFITKEAIEKGKTTGGSAVSRINSNVMRINSRRA